jgi:membrane protein
MRTIGRRIFDFWWGQGIADDVPALTYYLLLSLAPFALGLAALEAFLLEDLLSAIEVANQLNRFLPEAVHDDVESLVIGTRDNSPLLLCLAIVTMLWTTSGAIGVIERVESRILDCPRHNVVTGRIRNVGLGALVAVIFVAGAAGAPVIGDVVRLLRLDALFPGVLGILFQALGSIFVFALIYRYAPRSRLGWRASIIGALPAGIAVQAIPAIVGLYFGAAAGFAAVRVFLLLAVLLLGLYVMATVMCVGAGVAVNSEQRRRDRKSRIRPVAGAPKSMVGGDQDVDDAPTTPPALSGSVRA